MANPNIVNVVTINGKTAWQAPTTVLANVVVNAANSSTVLKINDILVANFSGTSITTNVIIGRGSTLYYIAGNMAIPSSSTLMVLAKDSIIYMEEGDYLQANVSAASSATLLCSYEIIS